MLCDSATYGLREVLLWLASFPGIFRCPCTRLQDDATFWPKNDARSNLISTKFQNFLEGKGEWACPQTPLAAPVT